jgi:type III secretory pathway lipoprotein EscJ
LHRGDEEASEIWIAKEHSHNENLEMSSVFKFRVSERMKDMCSKGVVASRIRVAICDELCDGDDKHPDLPTSIQVFQKYQLAVVVLWLFSAFSILI